MDEKVILLVLHEARKAQDKYGPPSSSHESLGVLLEEFQELTSAIRGRSLAEVAKESIQVAAVALRLAAACLCASSEFKERSSLS